MYIIYKHKNLITGKSYIGQTKHSIEHRLKQHIQAMSNRTKNKYPFLLALQKYGLKYWISGELDRTSSKNHANKLEKYYIEKYDTFKTGYNATVGGDYFEGYKPTKGEKHHASDKTFYTLYHKTLPTFTGTRHTFCETYGATTGAFTKLVKKKLLRLKGFALTKENAIKQPISRARKLKANDFKSYQKKFFKSILTKQFNKNLKNNK